MKDENLNREVTFGPFITLKSSKMTSHDVITENFQEKIDKKDTTQRDLPGKGFKG